MDGDRPFFIPIVLPDTDADPITPYYGPGELFPPWVRGKGTLEAVIYTAQLWVYEKSDPCPGEGRCHGCLCWCDWCGNVRNVCDANEWPQRCDLHQRYPQRPVRPPPDPRQLYLPGFGPPV